MKIDIGKRTIYHGTDGSEAVVSDGVIFIKDAQGNGEPFLISKPLTGVRLTSCGKNSKENAYEQG